MKILVLDAHSPASLAVVRSLARQGLEVDVAGEEGEFNLAFYSRYPRKKFFYPSPADSIEAFLNSLRKTAEEGEYDLLIPVTDRTIVPLHRSREIIAGLRSVALPEFGPLEATLDKGKTLRLALESGVPIPKTAFLDGEGEAKKDKVNIAYPVVVKSRFSKYIAGGRLISDDGPRFCNSDGALDEAYEAKGGRIPAPFVQEMVMGDGYGISVLMDKGEVKALFAHRRIREENPLGARSSYCESIAPPSLMKEHAIKLLKKLNWSGVAMVEFKLDRRDDTPKLMEINGRFWGSLPLAIAAGVDFPHLYYQMLAGDEVRRVTTYETGLKARFLYADIQHLINVLKGPPYPWLGTYPGKVKTVFDFLASFRPGIKYFNLDLKDPKPGLMENGRFIFKELPGRLVK